MKDPILDKLKTDAGIVLADLWRTIRHQPPVEEWTHPRLGQAAPGNTESKPVGRHPSGLCYFHLN